MKISQITDYIETGSTDECKQSCQAVILNDKSLKNICQFLKDLIRHLESTKSQVRIATFCVNIKR